ncbi:retrovirus-related Pol polyprotein from transposon 17.6 [Trichonephila inaurata madagascariensis]|uniref:Retrovirus-related Pol polyprotein from transposon 17.6 n=1 Tax=Trichonephila inaurata madagascariensis TaxID=2747483 RepID=A0A8X6XJ73_9ARAC|nr:retrovirus-related Pol polyprotein from transposon 17.6 [Trichonephila inaurata madagascariensis]
MTPLTPSMFLHDLKQKGIPDLDILDSSSLNKKACLQTTREKDLRKDFAQNIWATSSVVPKKTETFPKGGYKNGLRAVLLQEGQTVAYGSVSLTQTQQRYAQIEKELLTVIYGLQHFNYYTYGRIVTAQTDHKPILGLSKKPYDTIYPRLQRMLLRLNKYNIQLEYVPGKNLVIADALSRAQSTTNNFDEVLGQEATVRINLLTQASPTK